MPRPAVPLSIGYVFFWLLCWSNASAAQPNIIFILADDLGQPDLGCYGNTQISTPRLDRMAAEGTRFTQAYCGAPICAPSRTVLNVGLHSGHAPVRGNREIAPGEGQHPLPADTVTVAELLKQAGYATGAMGKWGMGMFDTTGSPLKQGYDRFFGYNCQRHAHTYFPDHLYDDDRRIPLAGNEGDGIGKTYAQDLIQQAALDFVRQNSQRPFFLYYAVTLPHGKHEIDDLGAYRDRPWGRQEKAFAAQVSRLDSDVGQLLDLLAELGIDDNTIVCFAGDNGMISTGESLRPKTGPQLRGGKGTMYEGGLRQPALVRWPGTVPAGRVSDEPWAFWDFLPTAVELAGATLPAGFETDGLSLVSFLKGGKAPEREYFYWELHQGNTRPAPQMAVRFGPWKALRESPVAPIELYNLDDDVGETRDLAAAHPELVAKAEALMRQAHRDDSAWPIRFGKKTAAAGRPNVIVILTDDLGYADLGAFGGSEIPTPHLDALAAGGVKCTHAYTAAAICVPSRMALMTGSYPARFGVYDNVYGPIDNRLWLEQATMADRLRAAGYRTSLVGKWHLSGNGKGREFTLAGPHERGFDEVMGITGGMDDYWPGTPLIRWTGSAYETFPSPRYLTDQFGQEAVEAIHRHRERPFFLYLAFNAPHAPLQALDEDRALTAAADTSPDRMTYAGMVAAIDRNVGRVMEALRETGLERNTLVVFLNDNGGGGNNAGIHTRNTARNIPLRGHKFDVLEGGVRVPMILHWPARLPAGETFTGVTSSMDVLPTALAAVGAEVPAGLDGVDLVPFLVGDRAGSPHDVLCWKQRIWSRPNERPKSWPKAESRYQFAIRRGRWKALRLDQPFAGDASAERAWELYDLARDSGELQDVSSEHPKLTAELAAEFAAWSSWMSPRLSAD